MAVSVGYSVLGYTITSESSAIATPSPFRSGLPFPNLDPRTRNSSTGESSAGGSNGLTMVQVTRFHQKLDDTKTHCLVSPASS